MKSKKTVENYSKYSTIFVRFIKLPHGDVEKFLEQENLFGICVSFALNRWAIEVPRGQEKLYQDKLKNYPEIQHVYASKEI